MRKIEKKNRVQRLIDIEQVEKERKKRENK